MSHWFSAAGGSIGTGPALGVMAAITTVLTALFLLGKGLRSVWHTIKRANETIDSLQEMIREWKGEKPNNGDPGRPSLPVRIANVERSLAGHIQAHHNPGTSPRRGG